MSGAELAFVIGVISGTITIVESIVDICGRSRNQDFPEAFCDQAQKLPFIRETLIEIEKRLSGCSQNESSIDALQQIVQSCHKKLSLLETIFSRNIPEPNASRIGRLVMSVRARRQGSRATQLTKDVLDDVQLLAHRLAAQAVTERQVPETEAIIISTSSTTDTRLRSIHRGCGRQNTHSISGDQNISLGAGTLYIAEHQIFNEWVN